MNKKFLVTTSWDDGHKLDLKLARLLKKYQLQGTFYISPRTHEFNRGDLLIDGEIAQISQDFEIGAHTLTHPHLSKIPLKRAADEIKGSRVYLEKILGKKVISFCYPYGDYNQEVVDLVKKNGFVLGRTASRYAFELSGNQFTLPTSFHTYNHLSDIDKIINFTGFNLAKLYRYTNWEYLAMDLFDWALKHHFLFHLWAHSWELEKFKTWDKLERVFQHLAGRKNVAYVTNGELIT